jgi:hypothetical protein
MNELVDADIQRSSIRMGTHGRNDDPTGDCNSIPDIHEPTPPRPTLLPSGHIVDGKNTLQTFDIRSFVFMERSDYLHQSGDGRRNRGNGSAAAVVSSTHETYTSSHSSKQLPPQLQTRP